MAKTHLRYCFYYNLLLNGKNKLAENALKAFIKSNSIATLTLIIFYVFTYALDQALILSLPEIYINTNLQKTSKLALELFIKGQKYGKLQPSTTSYNCSFKVKNSDLYYENSHIEYYYFCWQYKYYFDIANVIGPKCVSFAALFFCKKINF